MIQPVQQEPTLGDLVIEDLTQQLAQKCKELAVITVQYRQLASYVQSNAEALGLTTAPAEAPASPVEEKPAEAPVGKNK